MQRAGICVIVHVDATIHSATQPFSEYPLCTKHNRAVGPNFPVKGKRNQARYQQGGAGTHPTRLQSSCCTFRLVTPGNQVRSENVSSLFRGKVARPLRIIPTNGALSGVRGSSVQWLDTLCEAQQLGLNVWLCHLVALSVTQPPWASASSSVKWE